MTPATFDRDLVLEVEHIFERTVEAVGPKMRSVRRIDQLGGDAHAAAALAHRAFEDIADAQFAADLQPGSAPSLPLPDKPSIAVLPFANMSGDPEQEYFADGMVEEIITALSRIRWLFVIARNSTFTYKGRAVEVKPH